jgi:hypothetical protein
MIGKFELNRLLLTAAGRVLQLRAMVACDEGPIVPLWNKDQN